MLCLYPKPENESSTSTNSILGQNAPGKTDTSHDRSEYLSSIESRIKRMESLLQTSSFMVNSPSPAAGTTSSEAIKEQTASPPSGDLSNLVISDAGAQKYIGMQLHRVAVVTRYDLTDY